MRPRLPVILTPCLAIAEGREAQEVLMEVRQKIGTGVASISRQPGAQLATANLGTRYR